MYVLQFGSCIQKVGGALHLVNLVNLVLSIIKQRDEDFTRCLATYDQIILVSRNISVGVGYIYVITQGN